MGKKIPMWQILICVVFTLGIIMYSIFLSYGEAHMPLILSSALVCIVAEQASTCLRQLEENRKLHTDHQVIHLRSEVLRGHQVIQLHAIDHRAGVVHIVR